MNKPTTRPVDAPRALQPERMGDITFKQVRCFLAASASSSFCQAAKQVFLSQPAFCRVIQELESSVGEDLFTRSNLGIKLSTAGAALLPHAQRLMACYSTTVAAVTKRRSAEKSRFLLAGDHIVMAPVLPTLLGRLRTNFEAPSLLYEDGTKQQVIASVLQGHADCGVCIMLGDQADHPELQCTPLLNAFLGLLTSPDFALPSNIGSLADLDAINLVRYDDDTAISQLLQLGAERFDAYYASSVVCNDISAAYAMVQHGQVAAVASGIGASHPQARGLRFMPLPGLRPTISVSLISRRDVRLDDQRALMKELTRVCVLEAQWHPSVTRHSCN